MPGRDGGAGGSSGTGAGTNAGEEAGVGGGVVTGGPGGAGSANIAGSASMGGGGVLGNGNSCGGPGSGPDLEDVCRDFLRNVCKRGKRCRFRHLDFSEVPDLGAQKNEFVFCHDHQNKECTRPNCRFVHGSKEDEDYYKQTGELPPRLRSRVAAGLGLSPTELPYSRGEVPLCRDFLKGECQRGNKCKFRHVQKDRDYDPAPPQPRDRPALRRRPGPDHRPGHGAAPRLHGARGGFRGARGRVHGAAPAGDHHEPRHLPHGVVPDRQPEHADHRPAALTGGGGDAPAPAVPYCSEDCPAPPPPPPPTTEGHCHVNLMLPAPTPPHPTPSPTALVDPAPPVLRIAAPCQVPPPHAAEVEPRGRRGLPFCEPLLCADWLSRGCVR